MHIAGIRRVPRHAVAPMIRDAALRSASAEAIDTAGCAACTIAQPQLLTTREDLWVARNPSSEFLCRNALILSKNIVLRVRVLSRADGERKMG